MPLLSQDMEGFRAKAWIGGIPYQAETQGLAQLPYQAEIQGLAQEGCQCSVVVDQIVTCCGWGSPSVPACSLRGWPPFASLPRPRGP